MIETVPVFVLCNWMTSSSKKCLANLLSIAVRPSVQGEWVAAGRGSHHI